MTQEERRPLLQSKKQDEEDIAPARKHIIVAVTLLTGFLSALDLTIVATCIPTISSELFAADQEAWIGTAYLWSNVACTPLYGRLCDIIGRRGAYLQAITLFTIGTLFCGFAPNFWGLVVARFVAGMGGGGMGTVSSVIINDRFHPADRAMYSGISFAVWGLGMGLGGPVGGYLTQAFGWRAAFYAQIPVAIFAVILILIVVPRDETKFTTGLRDIDFGGAASLIVSIGALLQLLSRSGEGAPIGHDPFAITMAVIFPVFFLLFIYVELFVARKPVLPLYLLSQRTPLCVGIIAGVIATVNFNMLYHLPAVFEIVFNQSVSVAGSHLLPNSIALTVAAPIMGVYVKKTGRYKWATVVCCCGPVIAMALFANLNPSSSKAAQWLSVVPMGLGFSGLLTLTLIAMLNSVKKEDIATATGYVFVFRSLGQVFGVGLSSAVYQASLARELGKRFDSKKIIYRLRHASKDIESLPPTLQRLAREAFGVALRNTFLFGLGGALIVLITAVMIKDEPLQYTSRGPASDVEE